MVWLVEYGRKIVEYDRPWTFGQSHGGQLVRVKADGKQRIDPSCGRGRLEIARLAQKDHRWRFAAEGFT